MLVLLFGNCATTIVTLKEGVAPEAVLTIFKLNKTFVYAIFCMMSLQVFCQSFFPKSMKLS